MTTLVVFYSRSGTTRAVAEAIARSLGADLEEIREARHRRGARGYVRSAFDAVMHRWVPIDPVARDPLRYDLVVVGTPVWATKVSAPVRSFLSANTRRLTNVAFFVTEGGRGEHQAFWQMAELAGVQPTATLALRQCEVDGGTAGEAIASFVAALQPPRSVAAPGMAARLS
jgi:flavodoxin